MIQPPTTSVQHIYSMYCILKIDLGFGMAEHSRPDTTLPQLWYSLWLSGSGILWMTSCARGAAARELAAEGRTGDYAVQEALVRAVETWPNHGDCRAGACFS